jgi:uncharacterized membrane protein
MNTVFKVYNGVWITLGIAAAALVGTLWIRANASLEAREGSTNNHAADDQGGQIPTRSRFHGVQLALAALSFAVVGAGLLYPALATKPRLDQRFSGHPAPQTLNALDWMRYGSVVNDRGERVAFAEDLDVIEWFNATVRGTPVIAEASIGPYRGNGSRISIATGLPTVVGWARHQQQQRNPQAVAERMADLRRLFNATDQAEKQSVLDRYGVEYVVVGDVERLSIDPGTGQAFASEEGLAALASMVGEGLEIAFQSGSTIVYMVVSET